MLRCYSIGGIDCIFHIVCSSDSCFKTDSYFFIDFFKNVNDTYGHNSGDDVLKGISKILRKYSKSGVIVGRWGGEEFILIAPSNIDTLKFVKELDAIRKYIESGEFVSQGQRIGITISIGVEKYRDGWGPKEIVDAADKNLYRAKESGRNKIVY